MATNAAQAHAEPRPEQYILQMATAYKISACVGLAAELGIADHLAGGPKSVSELAQRTGSNEDALYRVLRVLAMAAIFAESSHRTFTLTPSAECLRSDSPHSFRDFIVWSHQDLHRRVWNNLAHSVKTGKTALEHVYGKKVFEVFESDPAEGEAFNRAMTNISSQMIPPVLEAYDFSGIGTLVDVAGGHGFVLCEILRRYPSMRGMVFDLQHVIDGAKCRVCDLKLDGRCETVAGNFFESVPAGGDAYLMQHIIHDWDDAEAITILRNCHTALAGKQHGKLLLLESPVPEGNVPDFSKVLDLDMLLIAGGRERTAEEYRALLAKAGFHMTRIVPTKGAISVIEAEPAHGEVIPIRS